MKPGVMLAWAAGLIMIAAACVPSDQEVRRLIQEEVSSALAAIPTVTPAPTATSVVIPPTPTAMVFPTPLPTPTPLVFPPTATPQPTPTPQPTATPMGLPPTPRPSPTPARGATSGSPAISDAISDGSSPANATGETAGSPVLIISPAMPLAGRYVRFTLNNLEPWQKITVGFLDPRGAPAEWIADY